jgi:hypothetical protein
MTSRLEQYLEEIAQPVSAYHRAEWREEARQHIEALVTAHEELGLRHEEAVEAALRSFGEATGIGKSVERESSVCILRRAIGQGIWRFGLPVLACFLPMAFGIAVFGFVGSEVYLTTLRTMGSVLLILAPVLGGWNVGAKASLRHPLRDVLLMPALGALLCSPDSLIFSAFCHPTLRPDPRDAALWLPVALASSCLAYLWQTRHPSTRQERA